MLRQPLCYAVHRSNCCSLFSSSAGNVRAISFSTSSSSSSSSSALRCVFSSSVFHVYLLLVSSGEWMKKIWGEYRVILGYISYFFLDDDEQQNQPNINSPSTLKESDADAGNFTVAVDANDDHDDESNDWNLQRFFKPQLQR